MEIQNLEIRAVTKQVARICIENNHYTKSYYFGTKFNFGLFEKGILVGMICYGIPHSHTLKSSIAGKSYKNKVLELNRLWVHDNQPKNTESWFIAQTMPLLRGCDILVSFADPTQGHTGIIYQATNWLYTGQGNNKKYLLPKEHNKHVITGHYGYRKQDLIRIYGIENLEYKPVQGKHRYIFILNKRKKKEILSRLKLKVLPYPKKTI